MLVPDPSLPDIPCPCPDVPACPPIAPDAPDVLDEPEDCPMELPWLDMPPPACDPVPAFPPALDCAWTTPTSPHIAPATTIVRMMFSEVDKRFMMPPSPFVSSRIADPE
jgi:hypothetical protein